MEEKVVGEQGWNNEEQTGSPMWKYLSEEYDYKRPKRGDIRYAEVMRIDEDEIIVDIGGKKEGVVPSADLERMGAEALAEIEVGDRVPVYVLRPESAEGEVIVSLNMARTMEDWRRAEKLLEEGGIFEGTVSGYNKGGLLVYFGQIRGFVPASQLSGLGRRVNHESRMEMLSKMEGRKITLKVIEVDRQRRRLIFSERAAAREWRDKRKDQLLNELQEGDIRVGKVRNLCDFGAFVDLGGADGLVHISELSWRRVKHPREVLSVGDEAEVYVLRVDRERKRIGLSLKRLQPDPWHLVEERYEAGEIVKGVITNIVDFGAFARVEDGIEGLIHVSELSDGDFAPRDLVREGEELYLKILSIDADRQRMGLSLKQAPSREEVEGDQALAELRAAAALGPDEEALVATEPETEVEEPAEAPPESKEELEAAVDLAEEVPVPSEAEPEAREPEEAVVEAEVELATAVELEEEVTALVQVEPEMEEELEAPTEPEGLEGAVESEEEARVTVEADAETEGSEPEPDQPEAAVEIEKEVPVLTESESELEGGEEAEEAAGEIPTDIEPEEPVVAVEAQADTEERTESALEPADELEAVPESEAREMAAPGTGTEPEEDLEAAGELGATSDAAGEEQPEASVPVKAEEAAEVESREPAQEG